MGSPSESPVHLRASARRLAAVSVAAFALGWFGDPQARSVLQNAAESPSELVSFFAKGALEDIEHAEAMRKRKGN